MNAENFVKEHKLTLPKSYLSFLNNGRFKKYETKVFTISESDGESILHYFFKLDNVDNVDSFEKLSIAYDNFKERLPADVFPIAMDTVGNLICILLNSEDDSPVMFWDHEVQTLESSLFVISDTLNEFLENLRECKNINFDLIDSFINGKSIEQFEELYNRGIEIEKVDNYGRTLIERATIKNRLDIVKFLVSKGACLNSSLKIAEDNFRFFPEFKELANFLGNRRK